MFEDFLTKLKKMYQDDYIGSLKKLALPMLALIVVSVLVDIFLPFNSITQFVRAGIALVLALLIFSVGYLLSIDGHYKKRIADKDWTPYRLRWSYIFRRNFAFIGGAFLIVFMFGTSHSPVYTLLSCLYLASGIALFAFVRKTREEKTMEDYGIDDLRDKEFQEYYENYRKREKKNKRSKLDKEMSEDE